MLAAAPTTCKAGSSVEALTEEVRQVATATLPNMRAWSAGRGGNIDDHDVCGRSNEHVGALRVGGVRLRGGGARGCRDRAHPGPCFAAPKADPRGRFSAAP